MAQLVTADQLQENKDRSSDRIKLLKDLVEQTTHIINTIVNEVQNLWEFEKASKKQLAEEIEKQRLLRFQLLETSARQNQLEPSDAESVCTAARHVTQEFTHDIGKKTEDDKFLRSSKLTSTEMGNKNAWRDKETEGKSGLHGMITSFRLSP